MADFYTVSLLCLDITSAWLGCYLPCKNVYQGVARYTVFPHPDFGCPVVQSGPMTRQVPSKRAKIALRELHLSMSQLVMTLDDDLLDMYNKPLKLTFTFEQISRTFIYSPEVPQSSQGLTKSSKFSRDKVNLSSIYRLFHRKNR